MPLHLTKVAFGCDSLDHLRERLASRAPGPVQHPTRYLPKRHEEMVGGSLFWILKHQLVARSPILGFGEAEGGRALILLAPEAIPVQARPKRAHQGWRYLEDKDAPVDLESALGGVAELPPELAGKLAGMGLL
ncbi:DUF1489 domain-containing protein [Sphingomonas sp.]|uniref:DUF1489 family protein n=1 Tax=Sphingomonas sp. TaxID=28214 RepID=UPI001B22168C|nr:DUF1489 domain-containing protein [Sphingomonas sp.]MBO9714169.1 DUF1489 domain-containing protein [Sphingomonas sp.]